MNRADILQTATQYVTKDRNAQHGEPEDTFGLIATYWSAHLDCNVTAADVTVMMTLLKLARLKANPANIDNWTDGCGYLACGGELATAEKAEIKTLNEVRAASGMPPNMLMPYAFTMKPNGTIREVRA